MGCGSDESSRLDFLTTSAGSSQAAPTSSFQGRINLNEVSGEGLRMLSAFAEPAEADNQGILSTTVSQTLAQLLVATDSNGKVRALGLSLLGSPLSGQLGALSTALMLCFMTRGIVTVVPEQALERLNQLQALASFNALLNFVRQQLTSQTVETLVQNPSYSALLQAVVEEWATQNLIQPKIDAVDPTILNGFIGLEYGEDEPARNADLKIKNSKFRFVSVAHQNLDRNGAAVGDAFLPNIQNVANPPSERNLIPPAIGLSFGDIVTLSVGQPTEGFETLALTNTPEVREITYYIYGPGLSTLGLESFPTEVETLFQNSNAFEFSVVFLGLGPLLNFAGPLTSDLSRFTRALVDGITTLVSGLQDESGLFLAYSGGNSTDIAAAWSNFLLGLAGAGAALIATGPLAPAAGIAAGVLLAQGIGFSLGNLALVVDTTTKLPMRQKVSIQAPGAVGSWVATKRNPFSPPNEYFIYHALGDGGHLVEEYGTSSFSEPVSTRTQTQSWRNPAGTAIQIANGTEIDRLGPPNLDGQRSVSTSIVAKPIANGRCLNRNGNFVYTLQDLEQFLAQGEFQPVITAFSARPFIWDGATKTPIPTTPSGNSGTEGITDSGWVFLRDGNLSGSLGMYLWREGMLAPRLLTADTSRVVTTDWRRDRVYLLDGNSVTVLQLPTLADGEISTIATFTLSPGQSLGAAFEGGVLVIGGEPQIRLDDGSLTPVRFPAGVEGILGTSSLGHFLMTGSNGSVALVRDGTVLARRDASPDARLPDSRLDILGRIVLMEENAVVLLELEEPL